MKKPWEVTNEEIFERFPMLYALPYSDAMAEARRILEKEKKEEYVLDEIIKLRKEIKALKSDK